MGIGSGQRGKGGQVLLYRSKDLRSWEYLHPLTSGKSNGKTTPDFVDSGEMWECPDFFPLGDKFVLLYSTERKVFWQVGEFDRKGLVFHPEKQGLLDAGSYYAPKSQLDAAQRRILWGWIPETRPESEFSAAGWAGCMSLPRVLGLSSDNTLTMTFLPDLVALRDKDFSLPPLTQAAADRRRALHKIALTDLACEIALQTQRQPFTLTPVSGSQSICSISFDPANTGAELQIAEKTVAIPPTASGEHKFHLYLDASVVECLADHSAALTTRVYSAPRGSVSFRISDQDLRSFSVLEIWEVKPISKDRLTS